MFGQSSYHLFKINGIFWLGGWGPDRFRDLPNSLSQTHMALLPVPLFVPSNIDFTTFVLSCLTPRLFKYFPKIMSHVWVCSFSRMNHCERTWASERRISIWGQRLLALLPVNWQALKRAFFQKAAAGLACVSHCAQNSPLGLVRFPLLLPKIELMLLSLLDITAHVLRGVHSMGNSFCAWMSPVTQRGVGISFLGLAVRTPVWVKEAWIKYSQSCRSKFKLARRIKGGTNRGIWEGKVRRSWVFPVSEKSWNWNLGGIYFFNYFYNLDPRLNGTCFKLAALKVWHYHSPSADSCVFWNFSQKKETWSDAVKKYHRPFSEDPHCPFTCPCSLCFLGWKCEGSVSFIESLGKEGLDTEVFRICLWIWKAKRCLPVYWRKRQR